MKQNYNQIKLEEDDENQTTVIAAVDTLTTPTTIIVTSEDNKNQLVSKSNDGPEKPHEGVLKQSNTNNHHPSDSDEHVEEQSEEDKKINESPISSGEEEENDESDQEIKRPEQQLDFSESGKKPKKKGHSGTSKQQNISSIFSYYLTLTLLTVTQFYDALIRDLTTLSTHITTSLRSFFSSLSGNQIEIPLWISQIIIQLKPLWLTLFYLHFGIWVIISTLLIGINLVTFFFGPWAIFPVGGWGLSLYFHLIATRHLLQVSGVSTSELNWVETPLNQAGEQVKRLSHTAYEFAIRKYQDLSQICGCQGGKE